MQRSISDCPVAYLDGTSLHDWHRPNGRRGFTSKQLTFSISSEQHHAALMPGKVPRLQPIVGVINQRQLSLKTQAAPVHLRKL